VAAPTVLHIWAPETKIAPFGGIAFPAACCVQHHTNSFTQVLQDPITSFFPDTSSIVGRLAPENYTLTLAWTVTFDIQLCEPSSVFTQPLHPTVILPAPADHGGGFPSAKVLRFLPFLTAYSACAPAPLVKSTRSLSRRSTFPLWRIFATASHSQVMLVVSRPLRRTLCL
jgi:hypothetical protein